MAESRDHVWPAKAPYIQVATHVIDAGLALLPIKCPTRKGPNLKSKAGGSGYSKKNAIPSLPVKIAGLTPKNDSLLSSRVVVWLYIA